MKVFLFFLILIVFFLIGILKLFLRGYRNPKRIHRKTPGDLGIPFQEIQFPTLNNCQLYGWWIPASGSSQQKKPLIILTFGWGQNVEYMLPYIEQLHPQGFHLLAFDARNHGSSDSDGYATMLKFAEDIQAAIRFATDNYGEQLDWIGLVGFSIGGAASIYAAAHESRVRRLVTIGAFAHPATIMRMEFQRKHVPYFPIVWLLFKYIQYQIGATFDQIAPQNNIPAVRAETLIIHGEKDKIVPVAEAFRIKAKADPARTSLWILEGAGHFDCITYPEFWNRLITFLKTGTTVTAKQFHEDHHPDL